MNTAWLLAPGLRALGHDDEADRIVASLALAVERAGLREYYNPLTGAGLGERGFGFATLRSTSPPGFPAGAGVAPGA